MEKSQLQTLREVRNGKLVEADDKHPKSHAVGWLVENGYLKGRNRKTLSSEGPHYSQLQLTTLGATTLEQKQGWKTKAAKWLCLTLAASVLGLLIGYFGEPLLDEWLKQ
jgi:hypothetical protein